MGRKPDSAMQKAMGARLRAVREVLDLTQEALAEVAGVGLTTVSGWEGGRNKIDLVKLARLADFLGFTTDWVARGDYGGLRFDVAQKLQQKLRQEQGAPAPKAGRPRKPTTSGATTPLVRDATDDPPPRPRRTLHEEGADYLAPGKFT